MSVCVGDRSPGRLQVLNDSTELIKYTHQLCRNEKVFPKSRRWMITSKIVDYNTEIFLLIREAYENSKEEGMKEESKHKYAIARGKLAAFQSLVDLAYYICGIEDSRIEHWTSLIDKLMASLSTK